MNYGMDYQGGDAFGGGGGFSAGGGGDAYGAASSQGGGGGGARRNYDEQSVIPVTARMILAAQPDVAGGDNNGQLKLPDDRKLFHVKLVGAIRSFENTSTAISYQLEDGTGLVEMKQWLDENDCHALQALRESVQREHIYVKVVGQVKEYNGTRSVLASSIRPLSTSNELTHHFLEVVYSGEKYKHSNTIVQPNAMSSPMMMGGMNHNNNFGGVGFGGGGMNSGSGNKRSLMMAQQGGGDSGDALRDAVLQVIQDQGSMSDVGAGIQACIKCLPQHDETEIRQALDNLQAEGLIYTTINEDHYKSAM